MIVTKKINKVMLNAWNYFLQQTSLAMCKKGELFSEHPVKWKRTNYLKDSQHLQNLMSLMKNQENLKRTPIAERFQFNMHNRKTGKIVSQYVA